ncbi:MAG TPA: copper chaperone PCu(A)C [Stellaceae bacterium]|nr:copper chaperone PCu(A)C [Stellaceae bacterium]
MRRHLVLLPVLALCAASPVFAGESPIVASDAWARPTLKGTRTGAVYLMLDNRGAAGDRLVGISTPVAERAEVHEDVTANGVMSMKPMPDLALPAGARTAIEPGHYHIMLTGVKVALSAGDSFPITLTFASAPPLEVSVAVTRTPPNSASAP